MEHPLFTILTGYLSALRSEEEGQTFIEYALVLVVLAVAIVALSQFTGLITAIGNAFGKVTSKL